MAWLSEKERRKLDEHSSELQARLEAIESSLRNATLENDVLKTEKTKLTKQEAELRAQLEKQLEQSNTALANATKELDQAKNTTQAQTKELDAAKTQLKEIAPLKSQVEKLQSELASAVKSRTDTEASLAKAKTELEQAKNASQVSAKEIETLKAQLSKAQQDSQAQQAKLTQERDEVKKERDQAHKDRDQAHKDRDQAHKERDQIKTTSAQAAADLAKKNKELASLQAAKEDAVQENELLLLQLMQAQEELVEYYEEKNRFEKLFEAYKARWDRLEQRYPNYIDFGGIELVSFDAVSEIPSITWRVKDFAQAGIAYSEFYFQTVMQDGLPGLAVIADANHLPELDSALVPKLLQTNAKQLGLFLSFTNTEFRQIRAAATVLAQLEAIGWKDFTLPSQFDLAFWRPILKQLIEQVQALPSVLRYDQVKLKRELINPDYEHLWLEFQGLHYGNIHLRKFEARLGAALVQADGFSSFPKFEIPLIDGKTKPFESWYAESQDDSGAKLELRLSLEKNVFDAAVWSKLSDTDKAFMLRLVYAFPEALKRLEAQHVAIHRPWATWVDFAKAAVNVFEVNRRATKTAVDADKALNTTPAEPKAKAQPKEEVQAATPKPQAKGPKIISIASAPAKKKTRSTQTATAPKTKKK